MEKRTFTYVALGLLVWAILGSVVAGYYFAQYNTYQNEYENLASEMESISLRVNILLSYGNGTKTWYNNTAIPVGSTAFTATLAIADINHTEYEGLGILVTSINGVVNNSTNGWLYWGWDAENSKWELPEYSASKYILHRGDTIAFAYESYAIWPPPPPT